MNILGIIGILLILVFLYYIVRYMFGKDDTLTHIHDATKQVKVNGKSLDKAKSNFTYVIWIYIEDWNVNFGKQKYILTRGTDFNMSLGEQENDLQIDVKVASSNAQKHTCVIPNIPLQKWVCCLVSVYGRSMDVYLDGKLVKTCILHNVADVDSKSDILITPQGGFSGSTGGFRFIGDATNPEEAYNIYKDGVGSLLGGTLGMLSKYKMKVEFIEDNKTMSSFEI